MKNAYVISGVLVLVISTYVFAGTGLLNINQKSFPAADSVFLVTHWKQTGGFENDTPDHLRLGCWSTALAQIVYFHHLKAYGHVAYTSSKGYKIDQELDSTKIDFSAMANRIDSATSPAVVNALALYNYNAALAVNKDFGTDNYMHKLAPTSLFEAHYHINACRYISWHGILPYTLSKQEAVIRKEIHAKRPLFLHFANLKDFGHSVVIDGYKTIGANFYVHLNQGQGGPQDGWYDFEKDLLKAGDRKLRVIYSFQPVSE